LFAACEMTASPQPRLPGSDLGGLIAPTVVTRIHRCSRAGELRPGKFCVGGFEFAPQCHQHLARRRGLTSPRLSEPALSAGVNRARPPKFAIARTVDAEKALEKHRRPVMACGVAVPAAWRDVVEPIPLELVESVQADAARGQRSFAIPAWLLPQQAELLPVKFPCQASVERFPSGSSEIRQRRLPIVGSQAGKPSGDIATRSAARQARGGCFHLPERRQPGARRLFFPSGSLVVDRCERLARRVPSPPEPSAHGKCSRGPPGGG
jgi:hypothetical protein